MRSGSGGGALLTALQGNDEPQEPKGRCWLLRDLYHRHPTWLCWVGDIGSDTHLFSTARQSQELPLTLHLPVAACSAARALRAHRRSALISKHPASCFIPRRSRFIYTDKRMLGDKRVLFSVGIFFFFFTSKMFYIFGRVVFPFREVTYILTAVGGLF